MVSPQGDKRIIMTRRNALTFAAIATLPGSRARAQAAGKLKLRIITDLSGPYADLSRPSLACAQQAVEDFGAAAKGLDVEIVVGEHQNKADNAAISPANGSTAMAWTRCWTSIPPQRRWPASALPGKRTRR